MKKLLICFILIANVVIALAQERVLELNATRKEDNSVEISYQKYKPGSYTVVLKFSNLTNASVSNENAYTANNTNGTIVTLRPQNKNEPIGYSYSYQYIRGELKPKINPKFEYLLPYKTGTNMFVQEAYFANSKYFGSQQPEDWKCYFFITKRTDMNTLVIISLNSQFLFLFCTPSKPNFFTPSFLDTAILKSCWIF